jgi:hypothetical protein
VHGDRGSFSALTSLVRARVSLRELHDAGVRLEPALALTVVSLIVERRWTKGERFSIAVEDPATPAAATSLHVQDGAALTVSDSAPLGLFATTVVCPPDSLLPLLDGTPATETVIRGDPRPLALLQSWVKRAQSG